MTAQRHGSQRRLLPTHSAATCETEMSHTWRENWWAQVVGGVLAVLAGWKWLVATHSATLVPISAPCSSAARKWMPWNTRASMVSSTTSVNVRVVAGHLWCVGGDPDDAEGDRFPAEEGVGGVHHRRGDAVVAGGVVRVRRCREHWLPGRVADGVVVAVVVALVDGGDRTPEVPVRLVVPAVDDGVGGGDVDHREQSGLVDDAQAFGSRRRCGTSG